MRRIPTLERVLWVLSNGHHPDPTKPDAEVDAATRLRICEAACGAVADPEHSYLARRAGLAGDRPRLTSQRQTLSTLEFGFDRAVRTAELVPLLRQQATDSPSRLHWLTGSDLIRRMGDPRIFSGADLRVLAKNCHYHVLERESDAVTPALAALQVQRGIVLHHDLHPLTELPQWLAPFLALSSTAIRHVAEAADPLGGMLPAPAADYLVQNGLYREGRLGARLVDPSGREVARRSQLGLALEALRADLEREASTLAHTLDGLREAGRPHSLALVETSTGGLATTALAGQAGASRYFRQSRFAYDTHAKTALLGHAVPGTSAVCEEAVRALAEAMRREAHTDFALAESGMAGPPDGQRHSLKNGLCWFACAAPDSTQSESVQFNPFLTRKEHQHRFALHGLKLLRRRAGAPG